MEKREDADEGDVKQGKINEKEENTKKDKAYIHIKSYKNTQTRIYKGI